MNADASGWCSIFGLIVPVALGLSGMGLQAQTNGQDPDTTALTRSEYRIPAVNPAVEVPKALAASKRDGKPVLLDFGAAWCLDCRVLWRYFEDPGIAKLLSANFHLVEIDLEDSEPWHKYGRASGRTGIPLFVMLDSEGNVIPNSTGVQWRTARTFTLETVRRYLEQMAGIARAHKKTKLQE